MKLDLRQVRSLFSPADYARGMEYYRQNRVFAMRCESNDEQPQVTCSVRGTQVYAVRFRELGNGYFRIGCSCPRFEERGRCKHVAAAMIAYVEEPPVNTVTKSDRYAQALLKRYLDKSREPETPEVCARLVPQLHTGKLLRRTLDHSMEQFDDRSQKMISLVL